MRSPPIPCLRAAAFATLVLALAAVSVRGDAPGGSGSGIEMIGGAGLLEPPVPVEITFASEVPPGARAPASLGTLRYAVVKWGEPVGPAGGFVLALAEGKEGPRLYVDADGDGDLSKGGDGALEIVGDWRVRRAILQARRAAGDVEPVTPLPVAFVRTEGDAGHWYAVETARRTGTLTLDGKSYAIALVDGDGDGRVAEGGRDVLWFDANADGTFDPKPEASERLAIPSFVRVGKRSLRLSVDQPSGARVRIEPAGDTAASPGVAGPAPSLLAWRLAFAAATSVDDRVSALSGAKSLHDDRTFAWVRSLTVGYESAVRGAAIEAVGDPAFGADASEKALETVVREALDGPMRQKAITLLTGHPGSGAATFLSRLVDDKTRAIGERENALRTLASFPTSTGTVHRHMAGQDPPELKAAAYEGLAKLNPKDKALHAQALDLGHPGARGEGILALALLGDPRGLQLARKEAASRYAELRAASARVLVAYGKGGDLILAFAAAEDDKPVEKFTDYNRNGRWDLGEPFVDGNGNGAYDLDAGIRTALADALRAARDRPDVREYLLKNALTAEAPKDAWTRGIAIDVLGDIEDAGVHAALMARLASTGEKDRDFLMKLLAVAGKTKGQAPVAELLRLARDKDEGVRAAATSAAVDAALDDPAVKALVLELLASKAWPDRVQGAEAAGRAKIAEAVPLLLENLLFVDRWQVALAAVEALAAMRPKEAVGGLVTLMARAGERSRLSLAANKALFSITGMELPDDADQWKAWLAVHDGFAVPGEPPVASPAAGKTAARFYGMRIESARVVFVVDRSGSMNLVDSSGDRVCTRWDALRDQINKAVADLPKTAKFNMLFFADTLTAFKEKIVDATPGEREMAKKFVAGLDPRGETNVWAGLSAALDDPDVDTICLLTDGEPTTGEFVRTADILREVALKNRFRRISIKTISVGGESKFLRELAEKNGGTYVRR